MNKLLLIILISLSACATQEQEKIEWTQSRQDAAEFKIANSICKAEAYKAVPLSENRGNDCSNLKGFAHGYCNGQNISASKEASELRNEIFDGCMTSQGWSSSVVQK